MEVLGGEDVEGGGASVRQYRVKNSVNLFCDLAPHGFAFCGNYHRGDNWERVMTGIDVAAAGDPKNGVTIHGDWDNRRIYFKHPYRNSLENVSVEPFIGDLIQAGLVELCAEQEADHG